MLRLQGRAPSREAGRQKSFSATPIDGHLQHLLQHLGDTRTREKNPPDAEDDAATVCRRLARRKGERRKMADGSRQSREGFTLRR